MGIAGKMIKPKIALTIARTYSNRCCVMADLKSFDSCGVYGMGVVTSIVAPYIGRTTYS